MPMLEDSVVSHSCWLQMRLKVKLHADPQIPPLPLAYEDKSAGKRAHTGCLIPFPRAHNGKY